MLLIHGEIIETNFEEKYIENIYQDCLHTLNKTNRLTCEKVIKACDTLYQKVMRGDFADYVEPMLKMADISVKHFEKMARLFSRAEMEYKCRTELGEDFPNLSSLKDGTKRVLCPLGILFHIAAGNVDGLPAYSVIEGLLAGNINILKLPAGDNGLSIRLLHELIRTEPELSEYIYVFDVPSTDLKCMKTFADMADGIVVWGGDEAVRAARSMADITTKIIPWGHKLSFAYVTPQIKNDELYELALHICETNQVFCSSCQGIFVDTEDETVMEEIGTRFFEELKRANLKRGKADIGMRGRNTIRLYKDMLEKDCQDHILSEQGVSVVMRKDSELELSYLFRNVWVKKLPREHIISSLKKHKNHLQTCGLFCSEEDSRELRRLLATAGVVRITGADMSRTLPGEAHDGTYALREYTRVVEY